MGATLSKLWVSLKNAWTGGGSGGSPAKHNDANGHAKNDLHAAENGTAKSVSNMSEVKKYEITEPWLRLKCGLGEGPFYEESTNSLRFLDVEKCEVHRVDLNVGPSSHKIIRKFDISIGCTADIQGNDAEFIFGGKFGYGVCNKETGEYRWIKKVWNEEEVQAGKLDKMRGNDGAVDSQGRFWCGFMFDPICCEWNSEGAVFRLNTDLTLDRPLDKITIPNGTTWNRNDNTMYWADSPTKIIYQFDYDPATGAISNKRPFFTMPDDNRYGADAVPDGHCLDEEGYMWTALHGGSHVLRISPEGKIVAEIKVPTQQPTCPIFCGEELFITSAGGTSDVDEFAGSVFKINVGVKGLKRFKFKGGPQL